MNTCNTCKYWNKSYNILYSKEGNPISDCEAIDNEPKRQNGIVFETDITVSDDSGLHVALLTSANFGCILHTPKK